MASFPLASRHESFPDQLDSPRVIAGQENSLNEKVGYVSAVLRGMSGLRGPL